MKIEIEEFKIFELLSLLEACQKTKYFSDLDKKRMESLYQEIQNQVRENLKNSTHRFEIK